MEMNRNTFLYYYYHQPYSISHVFSYILTVKNFRSLYHIRVSQRWILFQLGSVLQIFWTQDLHFPFHMFDVTNPREVPRQPTKVGSVASSQAKAP